MKKPVARTTASNPSPVVRHRLADMLDALSAECHSLAHDVRAEVTDYERVLSDIETLAEVLRESDLAKPGEKTEWTLSDRVKDAVMAKTIASASRMKAANVHESGMRASLSLEDARRTIEELRDEDAVRNDVQRALA